METATAENYLKAVYSLSVEGKREVASTGDLAKLLGITPGSVTGMLRRLQHAGLVEYTPHRGAQLSKRGRRAALKILRRHRLLELFLEQTLGMAWDEVHAEAEQLEHSASDRLIERIDAFLGHPDRDPHGDPIPDNRGRLRASEGDKLASCEAGTPFELVRVVHASNELLRYLSDAGLRPGVRASVVSNESVSGVLVVKVGRRTVSLARQTADQLAVRLLRAEHSKPR
jgi:DtxR family Mn-dependent transcriptional regulator